MKPIIKRFNQAWIASCCVLLASCGGGGSGSSVIPVSQISGTVAAGAVMDSGTVTVYDATGTVVANNVPINSDGTYTASNIPSTAVPPFTLKASGTIGAAAATYYALAPNSSTVNITPVSHAMAANLANGDPATLTAGTSVTLGAINDLDQSYQTALSNVTNATGATGSLLTSAYTAAHDAALDNLSLNTSPSGRTTISTTANQASDDMGPVNAGSTGATLVASTFDPGATAATISAAKSNLTASAQATLSASDLTWLTQQLTACFATSAGSSNAYSGAGRMTDSANPTTPIAACDFSKFTSNTAALGTNFKHSGYYWMDPDFFTVNSGANWRTVAGNKICGTTTGTTNGVTYTNPIKRAIDNAYWNTPTCRGFFGFILTSPTYDGVEFLTPQIVRPLNVQNGTWLVKFPMKFADGSRDFLGTHIGVDWMVVKKTATPSGQDKGWRMVGDQRDFTVSVTASVLHVENVLNDGYEKWISSLGFYVTGSISETDPAHYVKSATVTGPGLPAGGINLVNQFSLRTGALAGSATRSVTENSGPGTSTLLNAMCGSILGGAYLGTKLPAYTQAAAPPCTSLYRLTWSASNAAYGVDCSKYVAQASYYYCNDGGGTANIADSVIDSTYANAVGQPYTVTMTLGKTIDQSDDGTLTYIARLNTAPLNSADMKKVYYAQYSSATRTAVAAYNGTGNLSPSWTVFTSPRVYKAQLTWNQAINTLNMGGTATMIDTGTTTINCNSGGNTVTSCTSASSWFNTTGQQPAANTGGGQFVLQARYPNGLSVTSSIGQF